MQISIPGLIVLIALSTSCQQAQETAMQSTGNVVMQAGIAAPGCNSIAPPAASNTIFKSTDGGQTWLDVSEGLPDKVGIGRIFATDDAIILASENTLYRSGSRSAVTGWDTETFQDLEISGLFESRTGLYFSSYRKGFFKAIPGTGIGLPMHEALKDKTVRCIFETSGGVLFVGCESGLYKSTDDGKNWRHVLEGTGINSFAAEGGVLVCGTYDGLLRSTDGGEHWDKVLTEDLGAYNTKPIAGGIITITDGGSWKDHSKSNRLRISTDQGKTWQRIDQGLDLNPLVFQVDESHPSALIIHDIEQAGKHLFCSTNKGIFRSSDMGKNWELIRLSTSNERIELAVSGLVIYAVQVVGC